MVPSSIDSKKLRLIDACKSENDRKINSVIDITEKNIAINK